MRSKPVPKAVLELFGVLATGVQILAISTREVLLASLPEVLEIPDAKAKLIGVGYGSCFKDMVATLNLSKTGVKIGLVQGASFPDPASLLRGAGKVHRHIELSSEAQLQRAEVKQWLEVALKSWRLRTQHGARARD